LTTCSLGTTLDRMRDRSNEDGPDAAAPADHPTTVRLRRTLAQPPARVWQALTDPVELEAWFWPPRLLPKVRADARPDGEVRIESTAMAVSGRYREAAAPRRLVFSWCWDGDTTQTLVTIELSAVDNGGGTELALTHTGFPDQAARDDHITGWSDCLDRLPTHMAGIAG
jgi:uncharacterized protein YndB with AHSA1/START domain